MTVPARVRVALLTMALAVSAGVAAEEPAARAAPVDQIELRLTKIEKIVDDVVKGRAELRAGMKNLLAKDKVSTTDARALCESVGDQTKVMSLVGGQIALLEREENQQAMSGKQRQRLAKAKGTLEQTPPKMDCASF